MAVSVQPTSIFQNDHFKKDPPTLTDDAEQPPAGPSETSRYGETVVRAPKTLTPQAQRALAEAAERRRAHTAQKVDPASLPPERNGRDGPEPIRYGDWERNGIISDF